MRPLLSIKSALCLALLLCLGLPKASSQSTAGQTPLDEMSLKQVKGMAKNALRLGDTYIALEYHTEWSRRRPERIDLKMQVAELHRATRNYTEAEHYYAEVLKADPAAYPLSRYHLAQMQMSQGKYEEAEENFGQFKKKGTSKSPPEYKKLCRIALEGCKEALKRQGDLSTSTVAHLDTSINRAHIEFSPIIIDEDHLIYGSLRMDSLRYYPIQAQDSLEVPLRKFYTASKVDDVWVDDGELQGPFNSGGGHIGNGVMREDGSRMYFTRCRRNWKGKMNCALYYSDRVDNAWGAEVRMNDLINMPNYTTTQPAIGRESKKNQEVIYFVSDRPGGKGGMDIWYTEYRERSEDFREPKNAGSKINTVGTEFTPHYSLASHTLYFSSDGQEGFGGLDIYKAEGERKKFGRPENLGRDINSPADDLDIVMNEDLSGGYLVSNRGGGNSLLHETCCDDIYSFLFTDLIKIDANIIVSGPEGPVSDYSVKVYIKDEDEIIKGDRAAPDYLTKEVKSEGEAANALLGKGHTYVIEVVKEGFLNARKEVETSEVFEDTTFDLEFEFIPLSEAPTTLPGILYEFNSADLTPAAKDSIDATLLKILMDNPEIIVEISSHTDNKGESNYNQRLSEKRARSVVYYLALKGIDRERLRSSGFGETQPIAANENEDGTDNPEGRRLNRRTEFKVVGRYERQWSDEEEDDRDVEENFKKDAKF